MNLRIKDVVESRITEPSEFHARALRAVGQDLGKLFPHFLEITLQGMNFQVIGRHLPPDPAGKVAPCSSQLLDKLRSKFLRNQSAVPSAPREPIGFYRTYTPADIERMDEGGANCRNGTDKVPDIYSLGELLRMVGRIVDSDGRRLLKLSKDMYSVTFEYEDRAGDKQQRQFSNLQLYKLQQQYYAERGTYVPIDKWDGCL